jgi:hypothetical protein
MCIKKERQEFEITDFTGGRFSGYMELVIYLLLLSFHYGNDRNPLINGDVQYFQAHKTHSFSRKM